MRSIQELGEEQLTWQQPRAWERTFELRAGEEVLASLRFLKMFGSLALAETAEARWTFKRGGFWRPRVTVRAEDSDADLAVFEASWTGGGTLSAPQGRTYRWQSSNMWGTEWTWSDASSAPVVKLSNQSGLIRMSARVERLSAAASPADLALLVTLGWYLLVLLSDDTAATAGVAAAAT